MLEIIWDHSSLLYSCFAICDPRGVFNESLSNSIYEGIIMHLESFHSILVAIIVGTSEKYNTKTCKEIDKNIY